MTTAQRLRKARATVDVAKAELIELRNFFLVHRVTRVAEARVLSAMQRQLTAVSTRLENMAKHFDMFGRV